MATSERWRHAIFTVAVISAVLFIDSAQANKCPDGYKDCDDKHKNGCETCIDNDIYNCGGCGHKCKEKPYYTASCHKGKCEYKDKCAYVECSSYDKCSGNCYDGKCEYTCDPGYDDCNGDYFKDGCEVDLYTDPKNCGKCGAACYEYPNTYATCKDGKCEYYCKHGYYNCNGDWKDGCEVYTDDDPKNCGKCGVVCKGYPYAYSSCKYGDCEYTCKHGYGDCNDNKKDGCEAYLSYDPKNCGKCGYECKEYRNTYASCKDGDCEYTCKDGYENCNGDWKDGCECYVKEDKYNCGKCGHKCPASTDNYADSTCSYGYCTKTCKKRYKYDKKKVHCVKDKDD